MSYAHRVGVHCIPVGLLCVLISGCIEDVLSDEAIAASAEELSAASWSGARTVGPTPQGAHYGGSVVTLNGVTYMVHSGGCDDCNQLWWTKLTPSGWTHNIQIPSQLAADRVSLAAFNDRIYMFHTGDSDTTAIWVSSFNPVSETWTPNYRISYRSRETPAIIAQGGVLYVVGMQPEYPNKLWMATMDASERFSAQTLLDQSSLSRPSLAVHNGRLVMAHRANGGTRTVMTVYNGTSWNAQRAINKGDGTYVDSYEPVIVSAGGYVHMVYKTPGSSTLWWTTSTDGYYDWAPPATIGTLTSYADPAIGGGGAGLVLTLTYRCPSGHVCFSKNMLYWAEYTLPFTLPPVFEPPIFDTFTDAPTRPDSVFDVPVLDTDTIAPPAKDDEPVLDAPVLDRLSP